MARIVVADNDHDALDLALTDLRLEGHEVYGALDAAGAGGTRRRGLPRRGRPGLPDATRDHRAGAGRAAPTRRTRTCASSSTATTSGWSCGRAPRAIGVPFLAKGNLRALRAAVLKGERADGGVRQGWAGAGGHRGGRPAGGRRRRPHRSCSSRACRREREARAAAADAVAPVADAMRTAMSDAASGTVAGAKQVAARRQPRLPASPARSPPVRGTPVLPVLEDTGDGARGGRDLRHRRPRRPRSRSDARTSRASGSRRWTCAPTLTGLQARAEAASRSPGPERTVLSLPGARPSGRATYAVKLAARTGAGVDVDPVDGPALRSRRRRG